MSAGKIVTFYSYKGGTGRSMAVANVAWILATNGKKVLVIDWDLEAPGLHRYFHPFLEDKELTSSAGLIDYFVDVTVAARRTATLSDSPPWWHAWTSLLRYTYSIDWAFPGEGTIDLVPAGRQGPAYAEQVTSFDWKAFYDELGGGVLMEALKNELRSEYDYVLIDSRTGISDTAGICTVQFPDDLVVCFTLNQQSIKGAAAAADSAWSQRMKPQGEPGLRVWPVPMRIELAEHDRLENATAAARTAFQRYIKHIPRSEQRLYWERVQVLYQPIFAYEELLAPFVEQHTRSTSMVRALEALTSAVTDSSVTQIVPMSERERADGYARYTVTSATRQPSLSRGSTTVFVSYPLAFRNVAYSIIDELSKAGIHVSSDRDLLLGDDWRRTLTEAIHSSAAILALVSDTEREIWQDDELRSALRNGKRVIPMLVGTADYSRLPSFLSGAQAVDMRFRDEEAMARLIDGLRKILERESATPAVVDPDDPEKGRWGGRSSVNGRILSAAVSEVGVGWYSIALQVEATAGEPLSGEVIFHLHPTFPPPLRRVPVRDGKATVEVRAWGAFTVGAETDGGQTVLELDLATDPSLPPEFRGR